MQTMYSCLNFVERKACSQSNFGLRKTRSRIREKVNKNKDKKSELFDRASAWGVTALAYLSPKTHNYL